MRKFTPKFVPRRKAGPSTEEKEVDSRVKVEYNVESQQQWKKQRPKPELNLTASGPFALGPNASSSGGRPAGSAYIPPPSAAGVKLESKEDTLSKLAAAAGDDEDGHTRDMVNIQKLRALSGQEEGAINLEGSDMLVPVISDRTLPESADEVLKHHAESAIQAVVVDKEEEEQEKLAFDLQTLAQDLGLSQQGEETEGNDQIVLLQFPDKLPEFLGQADIDPIWPEESAKVKEEPDTQQKVPQTTGDSEAKKKETYRDGLTSLPLPGFQPPAGQIGVMRVHQSGKTVMDMGGVDFIVQSGSECLFLQEVAALDYESKRMWNLGTFQRRMVVSPNF
ncbi:DNA-directed RNA polymerase III complex subunit Rpc53 [Schizosaccharomyces cryophilus OY26]|uniref:DNA-directed RNA polymerase III complex subunit Rpc53 n=1 Tax=Schizosaccharomyces cryophilus (strain OY26 / ATCC MYA-4695 / CBS 11777 / NBRC 106824 / NRRL Y48691) TaxID=653667 RepID=S9XBP0_SCHCR|nr:DNA-directed RNA polymerase III complex subunit Rpc53 [Schizosaccharomyces cryophilus OY26]EPY51231.1 DNA-directed RNA polymerase III complex subunit Rpc53 [Schizosaccharomyces cryophilus OY26]